MKSIIKYIKQYLSEEIKLGYLALVILLLAVFIFLSYSYNIDENWLIAQPNLHLAGAILFYAIPFGCTLLLYSLFFQKWGFWKSKQFVLLFILTIVVYSFRSTTRIHIDIINNLTENSNDQFFWKGTFNQVIHGLYLFIPTFFWWYIIDRKEMVLYGLSAKEINLKPYFIILACLLPLVIIAATQSDFLNFYPIVDIYASNNGTGEDLNFFKVAVFEMAYGSDFFMNEFFFRGFIILAFSKHLGKSVILPMAVFYVFIHFGKPLGETISSFFGGLILGIIAFETRSIYGGVILHIGIAYMMELVAYIGNKI